MTGRLNDDDRGVMVPVGHVMTIAITTVLLATIMLGATAMLENQQKATTRAELETVGNRIATDIGRIDSLASDGATTNLTSKHTERIAGSRYTVSLERGATCNTGTSTSDWCLELESVEHNAVRYVPIQNESAIHLEAETDGVVHLSADASESASSTVTTDRLDLDTRLGIGQDVSPNGIVAGDTPGNRPPVAKFTLRPGSPQDGQTVTFDASASHDPDGTIDEYRWDFDGDGTYEESTGSPTIQETQTAGAYDVSLRVDDNEGAWSNVTQFVDVSGLVYNGDLDTDAGNDDVEFTITNNFNERIELTHVLVDPTDDSIDEVDNGGADTIEIDASDDGSHDDDFTLADGGRIVELDNPAEMSSGSTATVAVRGFGGSVDGTQLNLGIQYKLSNTPNSTKFSDTPGGPSISNYRLTTSGTDVDLTFESTQQLTAADIELGGDASGSIDESVLSESTSGGQYVYSYDVSDGTSGYFWAKMTAAESTKGASGDVPLNDSAVTVTSGLSWSSAADWDASTNASGVVHAGFGDHSADQLELGYPGEDQNGDNLVGYWPLDDPSSASDASSSGNDGSVQGDASSALGIFDSTAYSLDGFNDYIEIPDSESVDMSEEDAVTVSAWVQPESLHGFWSSPVLQHSDESYTLEFADSRPSFTVYDQNDGTTANGSQEPENHWYHLVGVFDGGETRVYLDGKLVGIESGVNEIAPGNGPALIGSGQDRTFGFNGQIDEVRLYNRSLSAGDIADLHQTVNNGTLETGWKASSSAIDGPDVQVMYEADIEADENVRVRIRSRDGDYMEASSWAKIEDGDGRIDVSGLAHSADEYQIEVELKSDSPLHAPSVSSLAVVDGS